MYLLSAVSFVQVVMHEPGEVPDILNKGFVASPGFSTMCRVSVKQVHAHQSPG